MARPRVNTDLPVIVVLAGGRAARMGADKALVALGGATLLDRVLARLPPGRVAVSANGDPARFTRFGLPVLPDTVSGFPGPLAGVLAAMAYAGGLGAADVVTVPVDAPFLPRDLVARLSAARDAAGADIACAASGGRTHDVCALWPVRLAPALRRALTEERLFRVGTWATRHPRAQAAFATDPVDPFLNLNTPEDLRAAEALLRL